MFFLSKLVNLLAQPLNGVLLLLLLSLALGARKPRAARRLLGSSVVLLALCGVTTLPDLVLSHLESRYPEVAAQADLSAYAGVVVLGGALDSGRLSAQHRLPLLNAAAERMTGAVALSRQHPGLLVVFTGGEGKLLGSGPSEADRARVFFGSLGLSSNSVRFESRSRNTYENAIFTKALPGVDAQKPWLLLTSAWHMPRSMATFQKAGWNVTAYPVDFRTAGLTPLSDYDLRDGVDRWELALHELIGIAAYRLTGRL